MEKVWKLYILRCCDDSLYTGITVDVEARFAQHCNGTGAKYTRGRGPLELVYVEECGDHSQALKREYQVKTFSKRDKIALIQSFQEK